jgi:membrane peptidoglycan carboxypeptidase
MSNPNDFDDDVPFRLPLEPGYEDEQDDIYTADTEDIDVVSLSQQLTEPLAPSTPVTDDDDEEIRRLHASDQPLNRGAPEDESILYQKPQAPSVNPVGDYTMDMDIPFRLPKEQEQQQTVDKNAAQTLHGSGGLDPNPDFIAGQTMQNIPRVSDYTVPNAVPQQQAPPPEHARFQRPAQPQQRPAPLPAVPSGHQRPNGQVPAQALPPKRRRSSPKIGCYALFIGIFVTLCGGMTLLTLLIGGIAYVRVDELLGERIEQLEAYQNFQSTFIYDRMGRELFEVFKEGRRTNVQLLDMPQHLIDATLAIEDDGFYSNIGIDIAATGVAFLSFIGASPGDNTPGGSTITQQLVRNVLFDIEYRSERSARRKIEEIALAIALTTRRSKDDILEMYLNEIYYGNLAYGVQAASKIYFDKDVSDLTLAEAALLAGLPQAPSELNPFSTDPTVQNAVQRRWVRVLDELVRDGFVTQAERDAAYQQGYTLREDPYIHLRAQHFTVYAQQELEQLMAGLGYSPEQVALGGFKVFTTVDLELNETVQSIAAQQIAQMSNQNATNAAVLVTKPLTGEILAMVGSIDYNNDAIDGRVNVTNRLRQPGSTVKAFTYAAALEAGMTAGDVIWDTRMVVQQPGQDPYIPRNYTGGFNGPLRMRAGLANSYNIPALHAIRYIGVDYFLHFMNRFGTQSLGLDASRYGIALTLGGGEMTLLELTRGFSVFANQGQLVPTTSIMCVLDNENTIIYEYENSCPTTFERRSVNRTTQSVSRRSTPLAVLDPRVAYIITDILSDNAARSPAFGSNSPLLLNSIPASVKTGTTDDVKDNWTVGYTANVAVGVWVGNNDGQPMRNTSGIEGAAPIWNRTITAIYGNNAFMNHLRVDGQLQTDKPNPPAGLSQRRICDIRTLIDPATTCPSTVVEWFLDYPAGLPDGTGNLIDQAPTPDPASQPPATGSFVQYVEPGVYRTLVMPLNPAIAQAIQFNVPAGETAPPPPKYCLVPMEAIGSAPNVQELLFIAPPLFSSDWAEAERYAQARGLAYLPTIDCTMELLTGGGIPAGPMGVSIGITSPTAGQVISGAVPIWGTAQFSPDQAWFFKLEIIGGEFGNWVDIQDVRYDSVSSGQLGTLPALPAGNYVLRLVLIGLDGNILQASEVPFTAQ